VLFVCAQELLAKSAMHTEMARKPAPECGAMQKLWPSTGWNLPYCL